MVNLGWVPKENRKDIKMGSEPLGTTTFEDLSPQEPVDFLNTRFSRDPTKLSPEDQFPLVEFIGLVRKGEE